MTPERMPPERCAWWTPGDATRNPPDDELFLRKLADAGFATYVGPMGLLGAKTEYRNVIVINRGWGRRWEITLREDESDRHITMLTRLPDRAEGAIAWLTGESLDRVIVSLETATGEDEKRT